MKLLLLLVLIHLLIFHQYRKNKSEMLLPEKDREIKAIVPAHEEDYFIRGMEFNANDSLRFSSQSSKYNFVDYPSW